MTSHIVLDHNLLGSKVDIFTRDWKLELKNNQVLRITNLEVKGKDGYFIEPVIDSEKDNFGGMSLILVSLRPETYLVSTMVGMINIPDELEIIESYATGYCME